MSLYSFNLWCAAACHGVALWDDLHGAVPAGLGAPGGLLDEDPAPGPPEPPGAPLAAVGAVPLAAAPRTQDPEKALQGKECLTVYTHDSDMQTCSF